jgi:hypothetical protein
MVSFCRFSFETVQILADMRNHRCPSEKKRHMPKCTKFNLLEGVSSETWTLHSSIVLGNHTMDA